MFPFFPTVFACVCVLLFCIVPYYVDSEQSLTAALSLALLWALLCHVYPPAATFLDVY